MKKLHQSILILVCALLVFTSRANAQCSNIWSAGPFSTSLATNHVVHATTLWDPDGIGPLPEALVVGGYFTQVAGVSATRVAMWNGAYWQGLGSGINGSVLALASYNGLLYAAGDFTSAGGVAANRIAAWNGSAWSDIGGIGTNPGDIVNALAVYNGELVAAGQFTSAGGVPVSNIARYNGSAWQPLGTGLVDTQNDGDVFALTVFQSQLVAGGSFSGNGLLNLAQWNGTVWSHVDPASPNLPVRALTVHQGQLYAGGDFTDFVGGAHVNRIAVLVGFGWTSPGAGCAGPVLCLSSSGGFLYAGGNFPLSISRWDGSGWQYPGNGLGNGGVFAMTTFQSQLIAGGGYIGIPDYLQQFNPVSGAWTPVAAPLPQVLAMTPYNSRMVAGGDFVQSTSVAQPAYNIVAFDGAVLRPLGTGMNAAVNSLMSFANLNGKFELLAGGFFTSAGGVTANRIARWIEDPNVGAPPQWAPMGNGFNGGVQSLTNLNGTHIAGGYFTASANGLTSLNRIARWNSTTSAWDPIGNGMNGMVAALRGYLLNANTIRLVAGGYFTTAGAVTANYVAKWDQPLSVIGNPAWGTMGTQSFNNAVLALEYFNGDIYAGGAFTTYGATTVNHIARWSGSDWVPVGVGFTGGNVTALRTSGGLLYAAGDFTMAGGGRANRLAVWNGTSWAAVEGGANAPVYALGSFNNEVHAGGVFTVVGSASATASRGWGRYLQTGAPWLVQQPLSQSRPCFSDVTFTVTPASGYPGLTFQWRKNAVPLVNGSNGTGSTIAIATNGLSMTITNLSNADLGDYDVVLSNSCGNVTSSAATLDLIGNCPSCPADIAPLIGDRAVNVNDLLAIITNWGACPAPCLPRCRYDIAPAAGDCAVNENDLLLVITSWGACP